MKLLRPKYQWEKKKKVISLQADVMHALYIYILTVG